MTYNELLSKYINTNHGTFTPLYTYEEERPIYNEEENIIDWELIGYVETMTAEEHYKKWLHDKENPPILQPNEMEVLKARVDGLENINAGLLLENAGHQIKIQEQEKMNKEQEVTNANLLLEIAMLKGAML